MTSLFGRRLGLALIATVFVAMPLLAQDASYPGHPVTGAFPAASKPGDPLKNLPSNIHVISGFGERPEFSPDGTKIAFVDKTYGQAFEYDLKTKGIRNLTGHTPNIGIVRVHYMKDGSFLLLAPRLSGKDNLATRFSKIELWWMDAGAKGEMKPFKLPMVEGIAISTISNQLAWNALEPVTTKLPPVPGTISSIFTGEIEVFDGEPQVRNVRLLATRDVNDCILEAQDFFDHDQRMTASCYYINKPRSLGERPQLTSKVYTIDVSDGRMTPIPTPSELYTEVEGIFPDRKRSTVECGNNQAQGLDICLLELKADRPRYVRLTNAQDYGSYLFSNPVVSPDGRHIAF